MTKFERGDVLEHESTGERVAVVGHRRDGKVVWYTLDNGETVSSRVLARDYERKGL